MSEPMNIPKLHKLADARRRVLRQLRRQGESARARWTLGLVSCLFCNGHGSHRPWCAINAMLSGDPS
jgi:hypothetical protein